MRSLLTYKHVPDTHSRSYLSVFPDPWGGAKTYLCYDSACRYPIKPRSPFSVQMSQFLGAKHGRSDPSYNAAKPLCEVNRCAAHTALPRLAPKQYKAESVVHKLTLCMVGRRERSARLELRSSAR